MDFKGTCVIILFILVVILSAVVIINNTINYSDNLKVTKIQLTYGDVDKYETKYKYIVTLKDSENCIIRFVTNKQYNVGDKVIFSEE